MKSTIASCVALTVLEEDLIIPPSVAILRQSSDSDSSLHAFLSNVCITWHPSKIFLHHKQTELKNGRFFGNYAAQSVYTWVAPGESSGKANCWWMHHRMLSSEAVYWHGGSGNIFFSKIDKKMSFFCKNLSWIHRKLSIFKILSLLANTGKEGYL